MPELPEVETVVLGLRDSVIGARIASVAINWYRTIATGDQGGFVRDVAGQEIVEVSRRGKWINIALGGGQSLLIHLRMTGRLLVTDGGCPDEQHVRVRLDLVDGRAICFVDTRKFGRIWLVDDPEVVVGSLGLEPLDDGFTADVLREMLVRRRGRIKALLLNQGFLAGLGNIYTDEALWRARIHPLRRANSLTPAEGQRLYDAIRTVLRRAIASRGTTIDDGGFVGTAGDPGNFATRLAVYGREEAPCLRCSTTIERLVVNQRGTHLCPRCQTPPAQQ